MLRILVCTWYLEYHESLVHDRHGVVALRILAPYAALVFPTDYCLIASVCLPYMRDFATDILICKPLDLSQSRNVSLAV